MGSDAHGYGGFFQDVGHFLELNKRWWLSIKLAERMVGLRDELSVLFVTGFIRTAKNSAIHTERVRSRRAALLVELHPRPCARAGPRGSGSQGHSGRSDAGAVSGRFHVRSTVSSSNSQGDRRALNYTVSLLLTQVSLNSRLYLNQSQKWISRS